MSVTNTVNKVIYTGNGSTQAFPFVYSSANVLVYKSSDIVVSIVDTVTDVVTVKAITTDYTVTLVATGNANQYSATVNMVVAPTSTQQLVLQRVLPLTQLVSTADNVVPTAPTLNELYDRACCLIQQVQEQISRAILQPINILVTSIQLPAPVANKIIAWNSTATNLENIDGIAGPTGPQGPDGTNGANGVFSAIASQAEAEAGTENTKGITSLRAAQAIAAQRPKASQAQAEAAADDTTFMTPLQVKNEVQKAGAVSIPAANVPAQVGLGSWSTISANTTYAAATDGIVIAYGQWSSGNAAIQVRTDASTPPTTVYANGQITAANQIVGVACPVRKGDKYLVYNSNLSGAQFFISIGA